MNAINIEQASEYWINLYNLSQQQYKALEDVGEALWDLCGMDDASLSEEEFDSGIFESESEAEELRAFLIDLLEGVE